MAGWAPTHPRGNKHPPLTPGDRASRGDASTSREERGRPPARRGRVGGFHWCPGHRGCRVTALVTASRRNSCLNHPLVHQLLAEVGEMTIASCELRADFALDHPKASPNRRRGYPCRGVRCVVAAGLPPSRLYDVSGASAVPTRSNGPITQQYRGLRGRGASGGVLSSLHRCSSGGR